MTRNEKMKQLTDGKGRPVWFYPSEVQAVKAIPTRFGDRLLLHLRGGDAEVWIEDTPDNRTTLKLTEVA